MSILNVHNLTKTFFSGFWPFAKQSTYTAVNGISFALQQGEILGLLGANGAGKTTTIQMLLGTLTPTSGAITYFGNDFAQTRIQTLTKIGYANGYDRLPARLTVWENLDIVCRIYGLHEPLRSQQIENRLKSFDMWDLRHKQTGMLSARQATRVMLAKAFTANPEVVLLDEPTASLDPDIAHEVRQFILKQQQEHGVSILITSHNMDEVTELCDRVLIMQHGSVIANSTPEQLAQSIAKIRIHVTITDGHDRLIPYLHDNHIVHTIHEHDVTIELEEHSIAQFLADIAERKVIYAQISIDKPTLEDYFLTVARQARTQS